jgi:DNA-binding protein HU-beta
MCIAFAGDVEHGARPPTFTKGKLVNKSQLIDTLANRFEGNRKQAAHALESVIDTITREVSKGEKVAITGFGSFEKRVRDARWVRNPRTGERIKAKKTAVPKFSAGAELKAVVSGAKKLPKLAAGGASKSAAPAKKASSTAKATPAKKTAAKKAPAKATPAKKTATKAAPAKKAPAKKATAKKAPATKATAKKTAKR